MSDGPRCETCKFWRLFRAEDIGECRRHAPAPIRGIRDAYDVYWPETRDEDWCGEHEPASREAGTSDRSAERQAMEGLSR